MARSTRNDVQPSTLKLEQGPRDLASDILTLGHAGLRYECRSGATGPCLRSPPRRRTPLHRLRPSQQAEARFTSEYCEILTY